MINFVYCFDSNYDKQAFTSISSLLDNVDEKINIVIIHESQTDINFVPKFIIDHNNLGSIKINVFIDKNYSFPNVLDTHVSEATYYRLFIDELLDSTIEEVVYLDSDIICNNNPIPIIKENFKALSNTNFVLGACTEEGVPDSKLQSLGMNTKKYFNAGFLLINLTKWKKQKIKQNLLTHLKNPNINFEFWDQDLFNFYFDGQYLELDRVLNWNIRLEENFSKNEELKLLKKIKFFHFAGDKKPWKGQGLFTKNAEIYHKNYRKIYKENYHIEHKWKPSSIVFLIKAFFNFNFFKIKFKLSFLRLFLKSLFKMH